MLSKSLRAWSIEQGYYPILFFYQTTSLGIFSITDVESEVISALEPIELLCLTLTKEFNKITRLEVHALSGISTEISENNLQKLLSFSLIEITTYDSDILTANINRLIKELGDDWYTPIIDKIARREVIKQYKITAKGEMALKSLNKVIESPTDLNLIITATPFHLFTDKINLRFNGFETISATPELTCQILNLAVKYSKSSGITPKFISPNSIFEGKEVVTSQFWVSVEPKKDWNLSDASFQVFLTSRSFEKWINPAWDDKLKEYLPNYDNIKKLVGKTLSNFFDMVEDVVLESLTLREDNISWELKSDLEMLMLINNVSPILIQEIRSEIALPVPDSKWKTVIILQLDNYDMLATKALKAARFHANASKRGFNFNSGYKTWTKIMRDWNKPVVEQEYFDTLELLVKYNSLIEILPDIESIIVDVDRIMSYQRRERQSWVFNRLRQIDGLLVKSNIKKIIYLASNQFIGKVDEEDIALQWIDDGKIEITDTMSYEIHPTIQLAADTNSHYIGNRNLPSGDEFKEMRIYSRKLSFYFQRGAIKVPGLEPFYEWKVGNQLNAMYEEFYE